ncbi:MAG: hypothetical protein ACK4YQ_08555 [Phenylobacterium sp.]|uniref:hypothetical protein n=1 Tax=Phenylobacterium sp. TaxID=1871053 RepID=UPI003919D344
MPVTNRPKLIPVADVSSGPIADAILTHAEAMNRVAASIEAVGAAIEAATDQRKPVDEFYEGATRRLEMLCRWLRRKGPWILATIPGVLVAIQAISPQAAKGLAVLLQGLGG